VAVAVINVAVVTMMVVAMSNGDNHLCLRGRAASGYQNYENDSEQPACHAT
jgi:hypothetical protein